ncbi:hypothetical protein BDW75DRAFT_244969 [Aspergillus navahoensis]
MSILVSAAARLSLMLGFHKETFYVRLDLVAANHAWRAFWACFVLDRDMSVITALPSNFDEEPISIDHLDLIVPAASPTGISSYGSNPFTAFVSREERPGDLWHLLLYPISACITLVSIILENTTDPQARSRAQHVSDLVKFLRGLQRDKIFKMQDLLDLCCEFERLVLDTILNAADRTTSTGSPSNGITPGLDACRQQQILSYTNARTSSLQLASGLMGNIPSLCSIAATTFSGLVRKAQISPSSSLVAPLSLNPETYGLTFA